MRACTDFFVSDELASKGAYRVVPPSEATLNHHQGGIPAWLGVSTVQVNLRPESSNSKFFININP